MIKLFKNFEFDSGKLPWKIELDQQYNIIVQKQKVHMDDTLNRISNQQLKQFFSKYKFIHANKVDFSNCCMSSRCLRTLSSLILKNKLRFYEINLMQNKFSLKNVMKFIQKIPNLRQPDSNIILSYDDKLYCLKYGQIQISFTLQQLQFIYIKCKVPFQINIGSYQKKFYESLIQIITKIDHLKINFYVEFNGRFDKFISCQQRNPKDELEIYLSMEQLLCFPFQKYQIINIYKQEQINQKIVHLFEEYQEILRYQYQNILRFCRRCACCRFCSKCKKYFECIVYQKIQDQQKYIRHSKLKYSYFFDTHSEFNCENQQELNLISSLVLPNLLQNKNSRPGLIIITVMKQIVFSIQTKKINKQEIFNKYTIQTNNDLLIEIIQNIFELIHKSGQEYNNLVIYSNDSFYKNEFWNSLINKEMQFQRLKVILQDYNEESAIQFTFIKHILGIQQLTIGSDKACISDKFIKFNCFYLLNSKDKKSIQIKFEKFGCKEDIQIYSYNLSRQNLDNCVTTISYCDEILRKNILKLKRLVKMEFEEDCYQTKGCKGEYIINELFHERFNSDFYRFCYDHCHKKPYFEEYYESDSEYFKRRRQYQESESEPEYNQDLGCKYNFCKGKEICLCEKLIQQYEMIDYHDNELCSITRANLCQCNQNQLSKVKLLRQYFE